jgi:hypothetical protein
MLSVGLPTCVPAHTPGQTVVTALATCMTCDDGLLSSTTILSTTAPTFYACHQSTTEGNAAVTL